MAFIMFFYANFSDKLIGLTGTSDEIADVAKSYKVYYGFGEKDSDGDYIVSDIICSCTESLVLTCDRWEGNACNLKLMFCSNKSLRTWLVVWPIYIQYM